MYASRFLINSRAGTAPSRLIVQTLINNRAAFVVSQRAKFTTTSAASQQQKLSIEELAKPTLQVDPFNKSEKLGRPISPHLSIYQPQITWVGSAANRVTGVAVAGLFYIGMGLYPFFDVSSAAAASYIHSFPAAVIIAAKALIAFPAVYHSINGVRHLTWDTTHGLSNEAVRQTGWTVVGLSVLTTAALLAL
ncbi:hypothetical protein HDV00_005964 [Rhizophlyctis rosea]|nr:hypothetical protein HDV00_005964 [Rhizophlyctis rosea]